MERHGIEWEQLGTHHEHLSVIDFKKEQRSMEVTALDEQITAKRDEIGFLVEKKVSAQNTLDDVQSIVGITQDKLQTVRNTARFVANNARQYDDNPEYELPTPKPLMSAKTYHETIALPLVRKLKDVIRSVLLQFSEKTRDLKAAFDRANSQIRYLTKRAETLEPENNQLRGVERDYRRLQSIIGRERLDELVTTANEWEIAARKPQKNHDYVR